MNKKTLSSIVIGVLASPIIAFAQMQGTAPGGYGSAPTSLTDLVGNIEKLMGLVFGGIAVVMFVIAGILFLTAQGDPEKVQSARSAFIWGVAGVIVGLIAFSIVAIVSSVIS
jgi:Type IV secretion system pilin